MIALLLLNVVQRSVASRSRLEMCQRSNSFFVVKCEFVGKILVLKLILYAQRAREHRQTCFSQIQPITVVFSNLTAVVIVFSDIIFYLFLRFL